MPDSCVALASVTEIQPGKTRRIVLDGHPVLLASVDGSYHAVDGRLAEAPATGPLKTWPARLQDERILPGVATA